MHVDLLIHLMKIILVVQAENNITQYPLTEGWGGKHQLFIKWKHVEAKVSCLLPVTLKVLLMNKLMVQEHWLVCKF